MNKQLQAIKNYITGPGKEVVIGISVIVAIALLITAIVLIVLNSGTKLVYQPVAACDLLSREEAKEMLGEEVLHNNPKNPVLLGHVVTSKCSYTDMNRDTDNLLVAAVAVRSGIDDKGVQQNKTEFAASQSGRDTVRVEKVGDKAYFNRELGQLNILSGRNWIIVSYGIGSQPKFNSLDKTVELAQKVLLSTSALPTF